MSTQQGPWKLDDRNDLVDPTGERVRLNGVTMPCDLADPDDPADDNTKLLVAAPEMAHVLNQLMFECNTVESMYKMVAKLHEKHPIIKEVTIERRNT